MKLLKIIKKLVENITKFIISGEYYNICNYEKYNIKWYSRNKNRVNMIEGFIWYNKNKNFVQEYKYYKNWEIYYQEFIDYYNSIYYYNMNESVEFIEWSKENKNFIEEYNENIKWNENNKNKINEYENKYYDCEVNMKYYDEILIKEYKDYKEWINNNKGFIKNCKKYNIGEFKQEKGKIVEKYVDFMNENYNKITIQNYLNAKREYEYISEIKSNYKDYQSYKKNDE